MSSTVETTVVRARRFGGGKHHLPADDHAALCGAEAPTVAGWTIRGDREDFERLCPERICKRCRKAEQAGAAS